MSLLCLIQSVCFRSKLLIRFPLEELKQERLIVSTGRSHNAQEHSENLHTPNTPPIVSDLTIHIGNDGPREVHVNLVTVSVFLPQEKTQRRNIET